MRQLGKTEKWLDGIMEQLEAGEEVLVVGNIQPVQDRCMEVSMMISIKQAEIKHASNGGPKKTGWKIKMI